MLTINGQDFTLPRKIARGGRVNTHIDNGITIINNWECKIAGKVATFNNHDIVIKVNAHNSKSFNVINIITNIYNRLITNKRL